MKINLERRDSEKNLTRTKSGSRLRDFFTPRSKEKEINGSSTVRFKEEDKGEASKSARAKMTFNLSKKDVNEENEEPNSLTSASKPEPTVVEESNEQDGRSEGSQKEEESKKPKVWDTIKSKLKFFFKSRPSKQELIEKKILKPEFDPHMEVVLKLSVIEAMCNEILASLCSFPKKKHSKFFS